MVSREKFGMVVKAKVKRGKAKVYGSLSQLLLGLILKHE